MKVQGLSIAVLSAVLATACGESPVTPTKVGVSDGGAIVALDVPINPSQPPSGPALGTGTNPGAGAPNTCPTDRPVLSTNVNNGKVDLSVTKIGGDVTGYHFRVFKPAKLQKDPATLVWQVTTERADGREGRYAQIDVRPAGASSGGLPPGRYTGSVAALFRGCGRGTESAATTISIDGVSDTTENPPAPPMPPGMTPGPGLPTD